MDVVSATFKARHLTNHPLTGLLLHPGDVVELPEYAGMQLVQSGHMVPAPDEEPILVHRGEPDMIIGIHISEQEYARAEHLREANEGAHTGAAVEKQSKKK